MEKNVNKDPATDDAAFRSAVLVHLDYIKGSLEDVKDSLAEHIKDDEVKFGSFSQKIGDNSNAISKGMGIAACMIVMVGIIMWIIDKVKP
jgi:hypothetical protein